MADERSAEELAGGQSIEERASEEQTELFPDGVIDGHGVSLKSLVKAGQRVEAKCALRRGEVPLRGGLPDPAKRVRLAVTAEAVGYLTKPEREDGKIVGWSAVADLRPIHVETLGVGPSGEILIAYRELLNAEPSAAAALLEQMQTATADVLGAPA
jgi:hypothetical protein